MPEPAVEITNFTEFSYMIEQYRQVFGSARVPLTSVLRYWWKWNEINIFGLAGPGQYDDLSEGYKAWKGDAERGVGFIYPILKLYGVLQESITGDQSPYSVAEISDSDLIMGTTAETESGAPYALFLQRGTKKMPSRPPILKTPELLDAMAVIFFETVKRQIDNIKGTRG